MPSRWKSIGDEKKDYPLAFAGDTKATGDRRRVTRACLFMKLYPRHLKVLRAANGRSDLNYISQRSDVRSAAEVAGELVKAGYLRVRTRTYHPKKYGYLTKWVGTLERTPKGDKLVGKNAW